MADHDFYATQSRVTDPGPFEGLARAVAGDVPAMRAAARQLVFHYRADGDFAENGIDASRISEIDTRYAEDMLARLRQLADQPLASPRQPSERVVGCCRDFTVLFLSIAREHAVPARARVGFAAYFVPGWYLDHVVAEVWDAREERWRLVDPELADDFTDSADGQRIDPMDIPATKFLTGAQAWQACRAGSADASKFVVDPGLDIPATRGWPYVRHNLVHDLSSLAKHEMVLWDDWGITEIEGDPSPEQLTLLDTLAAATSSSDVPVDQIKSFYEREEFRVPHVVTSYSPASEAPLKVTVEA
jgi:nucleotide-binding universal stress UspA family protein